MPLALGIIGLVFAFLFGLHSTVIVVHAAVFDLAAPYGAGAAGLMAALCMFVGGAFAFKMPSFAAVPFGASAFLCQLSSGAGFPDIKLWLFVGLALAIASVFAGAKAKKAVGKAPAVGGVPAE